MLILYYAFILLLALLFVSLLIFMFLTMLYILPMARGAVYVPSKPEAIEAMIKLANIKKGVKVAELGSGDGRVAIAFAQVGAEVDGYEVNPLLVLRARRNVAKAGLQKQVKILTKSYWDADLSEYDVVSVYGITYIMKDLSKKLRTELRPGAVVVSNYFVLPNWRKAKTLKGVHLYRQV